MMRIAIAAPVPIRMLAPFLGVDGDELPVGNPGAPLIATLIRALIEQGLEVSVYTLDVDGPEQCYKSYSAKNGNGFRLYVGRYRKRSFRRNGRSPGRMVDGFQEEINSLVAMSEEDCPDAIHAHWSYEYALAAIRSCPPSVITLHDSPRQVLKYMPNLYRLGRYFMARSVFRRGNMFTAVSPYLRDELQAYCSTPIQVIGNPIPYSILDLKQQPATTEPCTNSRIAMVLNGWDRRKNGKTGVRAFGRLMRHKSAVELHAYGFGYEPAGVAQRWARRHQLDHGIIFHGPTPHDQLMREVKKADILLHPALEECCPLGVLEAMALNVAVIGGENAGGVPWVLDNGNAGVLTDVTSVEKIYQALQTLASNEEYRKKITQFGEHRVTDHFSPDAVAQQYAAIYEKLLLQDNPEE